MILLLRGLLLFFSIAILQGGLYFAQVQLRESTSLNEGWYYAGVRGETPVDVASTTNWSAVTVPHTWNQWDVMDSAPGYRRDVSWYKRQLLVDIEEGQDYQLYFEGSNITTDVFLDGQPIGQHIGGYVGFRIDLTPHLNGQREHELMVRVSNAYNPAVIPSQKADFFIYGGLVRDVWLESTPSAGFAETRITTPSITNEQGEVHISASAKTPGASLKAQVVHAVTGAIAATQEGSVTSDGTLELVMTVDDPDLWSPANPALYSVRLTLIDGATEIDAIEQTIGFRYFSFDEAGGFTLNGEPLLLRGTHRHEEHAGLGAAMPDVLHRRDIEQIKEMGANFVRLGHYPQDPTVYEACNELGLLVWDELPWCRGGIGDEAWRDNTKRLLREQIEQNISHPSIAFWSLGNEVYWLPDYLGGDDEVEISGFLTELNDIAHELDPMRLTAIRKYYAGADLVDVFSPSIWSGWYAGTYDGYEAALDDAAKKYPRMLHMEYGGSSHVGRHTEAGPIVRRNPDAAADESSWTEVSNQVGLENVAQKGDWTENYIVDLFDWHLAETETRENFAGNAQWAFKDFGTPLRPANAIPYVNQKGLVDRAGKPKDAYYVYKSYWGEEPFVYIESHTWIEREGVAGETRELNVFSNADAVELFHDGQSLGTRQRKLGDFPASGLRWDVTFAEGKNMLEARAVNDGQQVTTDTLTVRYFTTPAGTADAIVLSEQAGSMPGLTLVTATAIDKNGRRALNYNEPVYFSVDGGAEVLKNYGTPTRSSIIEMANGHAAIEVRKGPGESVLECRNQDFKGSYLTLGATKPQTQALLLVQDGVFDPTQKDRINTAYRQRTYWEVPANLVPQNKFVRFEGPVLENDRVAYRFYGDSRHRSDIYGKRVSDMVMDTVGWNYHDVGDWGADILKVGDALGVGAPGVWVGDTIYTFSDHGRKTIEVLASGGDESTMRFSWKDVIIADVTLDIEQDWSIAAGEEAATVTLRITRGELPDGASLATGVVRHGLPSTVDDAGNCVSVSTYGKQSYHGEQLGMAVLAAKEFKPTVQDNELSYLLSFDPALKEVTYRFATGWERGVVPVSSAAAFRQNVLAACPQ